MIQLTAHNWRYYAGQAESISKFASGRLHAGAKLPDQNLDSILHLLGEAKLRYLILVKCKARVHRGRAHVCSFNLNIPFGGSADKRALSANTDCKGVEQWRCDCLVCNNPGSDTCWRYRFALFFRVPNYTSKSSSQEKMVQFRTRLRRSVLLRFIDADIEKS